MLWLHVWQAELSASIHVKRLKGVIGMQSMTRRSALAALASLAAVPLLQGCQGSPSGVSAASRELTADIEDAEDTEDLSSVLDEEMAQKAVYGFAAKLLKSCIDAAPERSILISPVSALFALELAAEGAAGETLSQMESAFGMEAAQLSRYLRAFQRRISGKSLLDGSDAGDPLSLSSANSVWVNGDAVDASQAWLEDCRALGSEVYAAPFDATCADDINAWVKDRTSGMIPEIVDQLPSDAMITLVNALAFDDVWEVPFEKSFTEATDFTCDDGSTERVPMMHSHEMTYLADDMAEGFAKPYEGHDFAFIGVIPKEGFKIDEVVAGEDGASLLSLAFTGIGNTEVEAGLPRFTASWTQRLESQLEALGVTDAFDPALADFSRMGKARNGSLSIGSALQKTYAEVDEKGTRAAAATSIGMAGSTASGPDEPEIKTVVLDRPFIYLIVDWQYKTPLFIGVMRSVES